MARSPTRRPPASKTVSAKAVPAKEAAPVTPVKADSGTAAPAPVKTPAPAKAAVTVKASTPVAPTPAVAKVTETPKAAVAAPVADKTVAAPPSPPKAPIEKPAAKPAVEAAKPVAPVAPPVAAPKAAPVVQPIKAAVEKRIEKVADAKQEAVKMVETTAGTAKLAFNDVTEQARAAIQKGSKVIEEFNDFTKGNVEAFVAAGRAAAKGAETLGQNAADFSRKSFEEATKALKTISAAKSPTEFFKLQNEYAKSQFDAVIAEASKVSETFVKIFGDVTEPLSSRAAVAADKVKSAIK